MFNNTIIVNHISIEDIDELVEILKENGIIFEPEYENRWGRSKYISIRVGVKKVLGYLIEEFYHMSWQGNVISFEELRSMLKGNKVIQCNNKDMKIVYI